MADPKLKLSTWIACVAFTDATSIDNYQWAVSILTILSVWYLKQFIRAAAFFIVRHIIETPRNLSITYFNCPRLYPQFL